MLTRPVSQSTPTMIVRRPSASEMRPPLELPSGGKLMSPICPLRRSPPIVSSSIASLAGSCCTGPAPERNRWLARSSSKGTARLLRMASDRAMRNPEATAAAELRRSRRRPTGEPYPITRTRAKPRIARTTRSSIRVNPNAPAPHHAAPARGGVCLLRQVIKAEHRGEERSDDAGDHQPHDDGDRGYREGDDP